MDYLGPPPEIRLEVFEEEARSILSENDSPDLPFRFGLNPYRGCFHACAYCYARPTHQYLDFGAGTDFDRRIVVKTNAPELLRAALRRRSWAGEPIALSGVTDCYQPLEASYRLTRRCLEVLRDHRNPAGIITKGALIERDAELIAALHDRAAAKVWISIPFADDVDARAIEPFAPPPSRRFETIRRLADAGVPTGVAVAPVIPGLNDHQLPEVLERARAAGATTAFQILLRVPREVLPVFEQRLAAAFPDRARKVMSLLAQSRGGALRSAAFHERMRGSGPRWAVVERMFELHCRRLGLEAGRELDVVAPPRRPEQGLLFD